VFDYHYNALFWLLWATIVSGVYHELDHEHTEMENTTAVESDICNYTSYKEGLHANCSRRNLSRYPDNIPVGLHSLDFSHNRLKHIDSDTLIKNVCMFSLQLLDISPQ
jgi:hypothetical protein